MHVPARNKKNSLVGAELDMGSFSWVHWIESSQSNPVWMFTAYIQSNHYQSVHDFILNQTRVNYVPLTILMLTFNRGKTGIVKRS